MKSYHDPDCECYKIQREIELKYGKIPWDDKSIACNEWRERSNQLKNNHIIFADDSDEALSCTCLTCGRVICGICV